MDAVNSPRIIPFSASVYSSVVRESNWFMPSKCELRPIKDEGSLELSLLNVPCWENKKVTSFSRKLTQPLRAITHFGAMLAIGALVAPFGVLYHGYQFSAYRLEAFRNGSGYAKAQEHAQAFFADLSNFIIGGATLAVCYYAFQGALIAHKMGDVVSEVMFIAAPILFCTKLVHNKLKERFNGYNTYLDNLSFTHKQAFGLVGEKGQLLSYSELDKEIRIEKHQELLTCEQLFLQIAQLRALLTEDEFKELLPEKIDDEKQIHGHHINYMITKVRQNVDSTQHIGDLPLDEWLVNLRTLATRITRQTLQALPPTLFNSSPQEIYEIMWRAMINPMRDKIADDTLQYWHVLGLAEKPTTETNLDECFVQAIKTVQSRIIEEEDRFNQIQSLHLAYRTAKAVLAAT